MEKERKKEKNNTGDLWDNIEHDNLRIVGIPEGEERENGLEYVFKEIIAENFPNLKKKTDIKEQEAQRVPNRLTPRHTIIKTQ